MTPFSYCHYTKLVQKSKVNAQDGRNSWGIFNMFLMIMTAAGKSTARREIFAMWRARFNQRRDKVTYPNLLLSIKLTQTFLASLTPRNNLPEYAQVRFMDLFFPGRIARARPRGQSSLWPFGTPLIKKLVNASVVTLVKLPGNFKLNTADGERTLKLKLPSNKVARTL